MKQRYKLHQIKEKFVLTDSSLNVKEHYLLLNIDEKSEDFLKVYKLEELEKLSVDLYNELEVIIAADVDLNLEVKPLNIEVENFGDLFRTYINSKKTQEECIGFIDGFNACRDISFSAKAVFEVFKATISRSEEINESNLVQIFEEIITSLDLLVVNETSESVDVTII